MEKTGKRLAMRRVPVTALVGAAIVVLTLAILLVPLFKTELAVYVTVVALAFAVTLQKYVASFAGYFVLRTAKLFSVGDRIRIGSLNIKGDVRHIGLLHFILDEGGEGEKSGGEVTGRVYHIPNHLVLDQPVLNFSQDFTLRGKFICCDYMFDEVRLPLPKGVPLARARKLLEEVLKEEDRPYMGKATAMAGKDSPNFVHEAEHSPRVMVFSDVSSVWLVGRFVAPVRGRNDLKSIITVRFLEGLDKPAPPAESAAATESHPSGPLAADGRTGPGSL